jgi:hypothetical protein
MITGLVIAAIVIGIGTWLRWVSRPSVISVRYVLDIEPNQARTTQTHTPAQVGPGRLARSTRAPLHA